MRLEAAAVGLIVLCAGGQARAEDAFLHYAQSGALLSYAEAEVQVLYAAFSAKEFDPELAKVLLKELDRSLNDAKKSADRAQVLVGDEKIEPEFTKLMDLVKRCETQLRDLTNDVEEQTGAKESDEPKDHRDDVEPNDDASGPKHDWALLKNGAAWLFQDIKDARAHHAAMGKKLKGGPIKPPAKPSGKREKKSG
jgi:hypothetical protein